MEKLKEIYKDYLSKVISPEQALLNIRKIYLLTDEELKLEGFSIEYVDYGLHRLKQKGEYLIEGEKSECLERASEIIFKDYN